MFLCSQLFHAPPAGLTDNQMPEATQHSGLSIELIAPMSDHDVEAIIIISVHLDAQTHAFFSTSSSIPANAGTSEH